MSSNFTIRTLSRPIDHFPMHQLFSPTALDSDLTYVDKTYYNRDSNSNQDILSNEKAASSNVVCNNSANKIINLASSISKLDLRNIGLFALPAQVALLTRLTLLDLSHNKLVKLPSSMDQLKHLRHLDLSHNQLLTLPSSIYTLTKLNHIDLSFNPISAVSANLARLVNLSLLELSNTNISCLPAELLSLSMTTIKVDNCSRLLNDTTAVHSLAHNPVSLLETCARKLIQPLLKGLIMKKKSKKDSKEIQILGDLPKQLLDYMSKPKACSSCGGPYFQSYVTRYRIVQRQDELWIPIEHRLCSAHWNDENQRILNLFSERPEMSLPALKEPCQLKLNHTITY